MRAAGGGAVVTFSRAVTLVPTYGCFNRCTYCGFRKDGHDGVYMPRQALEAALRDASARGVCEALVLSGEVHPNSKRRARWASHIRRACAAALRHGLLPHTNAGPLREAEMRALSQLNVSMGLMLESLSPSLTAKGGVHAHAPSKNIELRKAQLEMAGRLRIPFTTGLLLFIGESETHTDEALEYLASVARRYDHIQEIILQPYQRPTKVAGHASLTESQSSRLISVVQRARATLPAEVTIQVPANLMTLRHVMSCLHAGASDLGGIGELDEVNRAYAFPNLVELDRALALEGFTLTERLPVYARYDSWLQPHLRVRVAAWRQRIAQQSGVQTRDVASELKL